MFATIYLHLSTAENPASAPSLGDIRIEYHPHSGRPTIIQHLQDYHNPRTSKIQQAPSSGEPWRPFKSQFDFEFAEFALSASLNKDETNTLISLFHRCANNGEALTISNHDELRRTWDLASDMMTDVCQLKIFFNLSQLILYD